MYTCSNQDLTFTSPGVRIAKHKGEIAENPKVYCFFLTIEVDLTIVMTYVIISGINLKGAIICIMKEERILQSPM